MEIDQGSREEPAEDNEEDGHTHLGRDQHLPQAESGGAVAPAVLKPCRRIGFAGPPCRKKTGQEGGDHANGQCKHQDIRINR